MLERKVRQSLIEIKEQKDRNLIKETLVKTRLLVLVEHIKSEDEFNKLSENKKSQFLKITLALPRFIGAGNRLRESGESSHHFNPSAIKLINQT